MSPQARREAVTAVRAKAGISERRACALIGVSRTVLHYEQSRCSRREALRGRVATLAAQRPRFGYRRIHALLRREGVHVNVKCVHRLYSEERLQVRRRPRRRRRKVIPVERRWLVEPDGPNQVWSMDFVSDALEHGRRLKCLTIVLDARSASRRRTRSWRASTASFATSASTREW